jgi:RNA polymerase sigma-70 factor (ECF subfamily)
LSRSFDIGSNLTLAGGIQAGSRMTYVDQVAAPLALVVSSSSDVETDVVRRAQARDVHAFEQLYRTHSSRVYAICLRMTANVTRAEELTQKTFLTTWEKLPHFRGDSAFSSWLHRVAVNTVLADLRAQTRRTRLVFTTDDPTVFEVPARLAVVGVRLDLEQAIAELPPQARAVFVMHDVEGWQHAEIARALGVATGTSKAQLHRARKLLQEALQ